MQQMSERWLPAMLAGVLEIVCYAEIWTPPSSTAPFGTPLGTLDAITAGSGTVTIDSTNAIRRTAADVALVPYPMDALAGAPYNRITIPNANTDLLFPEGNEMIVYKGCIYDDGTTEVATCGRFLMEDVEIYNDSSGSGAVYIELNGRDRGGQISRAGFVAPYSTDGISTLDVQLFDLINSVVPNLTYNITPTTFVPAAMNFSIGDDPWQSALQLAQTGGYELFPDYLGIITARPVLNPQTQPVSAYYVADGKSIFTEVQRSLVTTAVPNVVIVMSQGSNAGAPLISYWWDSNQGSATFYNNNVPMPGSGNMMTLPERQGTYPRTVSTITTAAATTQEQNDAIALAAGLGVLGTYETIDLKIRDNPAHDSDDVVYALDPNSTVTEKLYALDTITVQLSDNPEQEMKGRLVVSAAA